jgi:hypothetical protein
MSLTVDRERALVSGSDEEIRALLEGDAQVELEPPLLADGVQAARTPLARFRVTGLEAPLEAAADARAAALILPLSGQTTEIRACTPSGLLGLLVRAIGLGPRPHHGGEAVTVPSSVVAERRADGLLGEHLAALVAHWRIEAYGAGVGWYLEVLDSELGLWLVEATGAELQLTPATATAVLDELAALPGHVGLGPS